MQWIQFLPKYFPSKMEILSMVIFLKADNWVLACYIVALLQLNWKQYLLVSFNGEAIHWSDLLKPWVLSSQRHYRLHCTLSGIKRRVHFLQWLLWLSNGSTTQQVPLTLSHWLHILRLHQTLKVYIICSTYPCCQRYIFWFHLNVIKIFLKIYFGLSLISFTSWQLHCCSFVDSYRTPRYRLTDDH